MATITGSDTRVSLPADAQPTVGRPVNTEEFAMGLLDDAKNKLTDLVDSQGDKVSDALDKAADMVDDKTGGKLGDKLDLGVDKAKDALDGLDGKNDDIN
jgi:MT0933-like antitoxin protein